MPYITARYSDPRRYLVKTLRETGGRIERLVLGFGEPEVREHRSFDEWSAVELMGYLRDAEREDLRAVNAMVIRDGARIDERRAQHGPAEQHYQQAAIDELTWEFISLRDETVWILRDASHAWEHIGVHPFRGSVTLHAWVQEMNERDLDAMWRLQRLREALLPAGIQGVD
jgi:hypothetical protein